MLSLHASELAAGPLGSNRIVMVGGSNRGNRWCSAALGYELLLNMVPVDGLLSLRSSELAAGPLGSNRIVMVGGSNRGNRWCSAALGYELLLNMVPVDGFEPPTHALRIRTIRISEHNPA